MRSLKLSELSKLRLYDSPKLTVWSNLFLASHEKLNWSLLLICYPPSLPVGAYPNAIVRWLRMYYCTSATFQPKGRAPAPGTSLEEQLVAISPTVTHPWPLLLGTFSSLHNTFFSYPSYSRCRVYKLKFFLSVRHHFNISNLGPSNHPRIISYPT